MIAVLSFLVWFLQNPTPVGCSWGPAVEIGTLEPVLNESSGTAISHRVQNRSYRHNDGGDDTRFFVMDLNGRNLKAVRIEGVTQNDWEDMAVGPCGDSTDCLFFGDIGDNDHTRRNLELVVVRERPSFPSSVPADYRVTMRYPDGPHNAEALAVHPDGTVYIATKDAARLQLFRLKPEQWRRGTGPQVLEPVLSWDWPTLLPSSLALGRVATAMDIAPDGKRFLILTYVEAVEFYLDLSKPVPEPRAWKEGLHFRRVPLTTLEQEEAIAYLPDGKGFVYDTEHAISSRAARIMEVRCKN